MDVHAFLQAGGWRLIAENDLGNTARVLIAEKDGRRQALKVSRRGVRADVRREYETLCYLNQTEMARYVASVGKWEHEVGGFWMECLRDPTPDERKRPDLPSTLGSALHTLHCQNLPVMIGLPDDRPDIAEAVCRNFRDVFDTLLDENGWNGLASAERGYFHKVRDCYGTYVALLPALQAILPGTACSLVHGDLTGDNWMVRPDGGLALVDWGAARLTSPFSDVAGLLAYTEWDEAEIARFLAAYFDGDAAAQAAISLCIELLARLYVYRACVYALHCLNAQDLDAVGYAVFLKQLAWVSGEK